MYRCLLVLPISWPLSAIMWRARRRRRRRRATRERRRCWSALHCCEAGTRPQTDVLAASPASLRHRPRRSPSFEFDAPPDLVAWDCSCSICSMKRNTHAMVPQQRFRLTPGSEEHLSLCELLLLLADGRPRAPLPRHRGRIHAAPAMCARCFPASALGKRRSRAEAPARRQHPPC